VKREIVGAVSKSEKPIRKGSLCKILSCAISSHSSFLTTQELANGWENFELEPSNFRQSPEAVLIYFQ